MTPQLRLATAEHALASIGQQLETRQFLHGPTNPAPMEIPVDVWQALKEMCKLGLDAIRKKGV